MRAAIYTRISNDPESDRLGVTRQERDCRQLCRQRGWKVEAVFEDDDRSAFSGKPRPAYVRMLERLELGDIQAIVAWHPDRLHRSVRELESFIDLIERTGVTVATVQAGDVDLTTPDGRMHARLGGILARRESEHRAARLRRKHQELAEAGRLPGGVRWRSFGYEKDQVTIREDEAAIVRELAERALAGESLHALCRDLNRRGVAPVAAQRWATPSVRGILHGARIAGLREYRGQTIPGPWPAIIDADQHYRLRALLDANSKSQRRAPRRFFLTGLLRCGKCGNVLSGHTRKDSRSKKYVSQYACWNVNNACYGTCVNAEPVEALMAEALFDIIDSPDLWRRMDEAEGRPPALRDQLERVERRMTELAETWASGEITRKEWQAARAKLQRQLDELRDSEAETARDGVLDHWREHSLREAWPALTLDQRRAVASAVIHRVVIAPRDRHAPPRFDPRRVTIERRL